MRSHTGAISTKGPSALRHRSHDFKEAPVQSRIGGYDFNEAAMHSHAGP